MPRKSTPIAERFWDKVEKTETCWLWKGQRRGEYGGVWLDGKTQSAHRTAYVMANGEIPKGSSVLHSCDNPLCVNPAHLSVGTHSDNMQDMIAKGRQNHFHMNKSCCKNGHLFTLENTKTTRGRRECRECKNISSKKRRLKQKGL